MPARTSAISEALCSASSSESGTSSWAKIRGSGCPLAVLAIATGGGQASDEAGGDAADEHERVGVLLLGHGQADRASCGRRARRTPNSRVPQMSRSSASRSSVRLALAAMRRELEGQVGLPVGVPGVDARRVEPERRAMASRSRGIAAPLVQPAPAGLAFARLEGALEPVDVAAERVRVAEQGVGERRRLRRLPVRVVDGERRYVRRSEIDERLLRASPSASHEGEDACPHAMLKATVTASRRGRPDEQIPGGPADPFPQPGLPVHHEVAERRIEPDAVLRGRASRAVSRCADVRRVHDRAGERPGVETSRSRSSAAIRSRARAGGTTAWSSKARIWARSARASSGMSAPADCELEAIGGARRAVRSALRAVGRSWLDQRLVRRGASPAADRAAASR